MTVDSLRVVFFEKRDGKCPRLMVGRMKTGKGHHVNGLGLFSFLVILSFAGCHPVGCEGYRHNPIAEGVYVYHHHSHVRRLLDALGYDGDYGTWITGRSSSGKALYITVPERYGEDRVLLIVSADGTIERLVPPGRFAWLNDAGEFVAWSESEFERIEFTNGVVRTMALDMRYVMDPGGQYFCITKSGDLTEVVSTEDPQTPLGQVDIQPYAVFLKKGRLYLFDFSFRDVDRPGRHKIDGAICQIFAVAHSKLELEKELRIPRPTSPRRSDFHVVDMDMHSDRILLCDFRQLCSLSVKFMYLYDLGTGEMTSLGHVLGQAFFLEEDIISNAVEVLHSATN